MHVGYMIKMERLSQKMKQAVLAKRICSESQLSRIENGNIKGRDEVLDKLSKRLGIAISDDFKDERVRVEDYVVRYERIINTRDQEGAARLISELTDKFPSAGIQTRIELELMAIRLSLVLKGGEKETRRKLAKYQDIQSELTPQQAFAVLKMKGMSLYTNGELKESLEALSKAKCMTESLALSPFERADFAYVLSVVLMANGQKFEALVQAKQALAYFESIMMEQRVVECHMICGVAYKNNDNLTKALEVFHLVEMICIQFDLDSLLGILHQNIGDVYSVMGESERAISHFEIAIDHKELPSELLYSIYSLVKEYEKIGRLDQVKKCLKEGSGLVPELHERKREYYEHHFNAYEAVCSQDEKKIENAMLSAFHFFKKRGSHKQWMDYAKKLADLYARNGKYKKAVDFYKMIVG
ncbi:helix-turn-helix domain-containing protein [Sporosarcina sp. ITBMC105]